MGTVARRSRVAIIIGAVIAGGAWWWSTARPSVQPPAAPVSVSAPQVSEPLSAPLLEIQGTRLAGTDEAGRRQWELQAVSLEVDRRRNVITLVAVTGWLYRGDARQIHLTAPHAVYTVASRQIQLAGGVTGAAQDGRTFHADRVVWDGRQGRMIADGHITVTQPGMTMRADHLETGPGLERIALDGHVAITVEE